MQRSNYFYALITSSLLFFASPYTLAGVNVFDLPVLHPAIPLLDEAGEHVMNSNKPYSSRMSCGNGEGGGCHDIDKISKAYHFEMGRDESDDDYGKKIWDSELTVTALGVFPAKLTDISHNTALVSPGYFGGFNCGYNPGQLNNPQWLSKKSNRSESEFLDYGAAGLIKNCAECHNGGGFAEKDRNNFRYDKMADSDIKPFDGDYFEWLTGDGSNTTGTVLSKWNWQKSGVIEPDCMICHTDFTKLTQPATNWADVRTKQFIGNGFFRYANSAIFAYLNIAPNSAQGKTLLTIPGGKDSIGQPLLKWDASAFDSNGKVKIPMLRFPGNENCMVCHKTSHERRGFYGFGDISLSKTDAEGNPIENYPNDIHKGKLWPTKGPNSRYIENCNSCHSKQYYKDTFRNIDLDADHNFLVGNSDEDVRKDLNYQPKAFSCEYCHNGIDSKHPEYRGAANPALPKSGMNNIFDAHRQLWIDNDDMKYNENSRDKAVNVHLLEVACQTCHILRLKNDGNDLRIRYRFRKAEDGRIKSIAYLPSSRSYWKDKLTDRVISRQEYLSASKGVETLPQTYGDFIALKTALDNTLKSKGYPKADVQLVWTESNAYVVSHNTRASAAVMLCDVCHPRNEYPKGVVSSALPSDLIYGNGKINNRIISQLADKTAYDRLVKEGVVKLDLPYLAVEAGAIIDNTFNVLKKTETDPFTSALRLTAKNFTTGEFREASKGEALAAAAITETALFSAASSKLAAKVYLFNNQIAGGLASKTAILLDYNNVSRTITPQYRVELAMDSWRSFSFTPPTKKPKKTTDVVKQGKVKSPVYSIRLLNQNKQAVESLGVSKLLVKLPYYGNARTALKIDLFETRTINGSQVAPLSVLPAEIVGVKNGTPTNPGYVLAVLNRLPERLVVIDLKVAKKK